MDFNNIKKQITKVMVIIGVFVMLHCFLILYLLTSMNNDEMLPSAQIITNFISKNNSTIVSNSTPFRIISSSENKDLEKIIRDYLSSKNIELDIEYAGTLEIMDRLNSGEKYDAVWASNSIWIYMLNDNVSISDSKSTSINPVVFGIKREVAQSLGFIDREIYTSEIINAIKSEKLNFCMSNPTQTNTGAIAYLGFLSNLSGNPEVLKEENLQNPQLKESLNELFSGLERSSGDEDFLADVFLKSEYDSVVTYESSLININKTLSANGREPLYIVYPIDGVSISDSPFAYIDNDDDSKKEIFLELRNYILSNEGQNQIAKTGRRTWYGGTSSNVDKLVFNPNWGIDTEKYIVPIKFPSTAVIQKALAMYQEEFRKPVHTVFCLDYSGSMNGNGITQLIDAMDYILDQSKSSEDLLQYTEKDKITCILFNNKVIDVLEAPNGADTLGILEKLKNIKTTGATNIYDAAIEGLVELSDTDKKEYNLSIILMTDGNSNVGTFSSLKKAYDIFKIDVPIYSIMFGSAVEEQLDEIAKYTNGKVFNGRKNLLEAFKEVRGYN